MLNATIKGYCSLHYNKKDDEFQSNGKKEHSKMEKKNKERKQ